MQQETFRNVIRNDFDRIQAKNPSFSLRAYSKKLNISPSTLSDILRGKRKVTSKQAIKILELVKLSHWQKESIKGLFSAKPQFQELSLNESKSLFSFPQYAILALINTVDFRSDVNWIARRLNIKKSEVIQSLNILSKLKLVGYDESKEIHLINRAIKISDKARQHVARNEFLRSAHLNKLKKENAKTTFLSIAFTMNFKEKEKFETLIRNFLIDLALKGGTTEAQDVVQVNVQMSQLTYISVKD